MPFKMTVNDPSSHSVGSGPTEKIMRRIIDATSVRMPDGRGTVHTIANDINIMVQTSHDKCEFNSKMEEKRNESHRNWLVNQAQSNYLAIYSQMDRKMR